MSLHPPFQQSNENGLQKMNDIFDSMYHNLIKMGTNNKSYDPILSSYKQDTFQSNLLEERKDNQRTAKKETVGNSLDVIVLQEEIQALKKELKLQQSGGKHPKVSIQELEKQAKFLAKNNQTLYRNTYKLEQQILQLKQQLTNKIKNQEQLNKTIENLVKQTQTLKKVNKQLLSGQKQIVKGQINDVLAFKQVKNQFQKQNDLLKDKLKIIQTQRQRDLRKFRKSLSKTKQQFQSVKNTNFKLLVSPPQQSNISSLHINDISQIKQQLKSLKKSVHELSSNKKLPRKNSICNGTPVKKHKN